jgi:hypothetical protein
MRLLALPASAGHVTAQRAAFRWVRSRPTRRRLRNRKREGLELCREARAAEIGILRQTPQPMSLVGTAASAFTAQRL